MSEATFTPGPWTFAKYSAKRFGLGQCGEGAFFFLQCVHDDADSPAAIADARLCAAAPDLYAELERTTFLLHSACLVLEDEQARKKALEAVQRAREVMRKADGGRTP
jgi:hypothetical protein